MFNLYYSLNVLLYIARQWNSNRSYSISEICQPWRRSMARLKPLFSDDLEGFFEYFNESLLIQVDCIGSAGYEFCTSAVHPQNSTWNLEMMVSNRNLLFQGSIFRFHVCFGWCISYFFKIISFPMIRMIHSTLFGAPGGKKSVLTSDSQHFC